MHFSTKYFILLFCYIQQILGTRYDNYRLLSAVPIEAKHTYFLEKIIKKFNVKLWTDINSATTKGAICHMLVAPQHIENVMSEGARVQLPLFMLSKNIQIDLEAQQANVSYHRRYMTSFDWHNYYRYNDIKDWLKDFGRAYSSEVKVQSIGRSHENRDILVAKICTIAGPSEKPKVFIVGGFHGRDWLSPAVTTYILYHLYDAKRHFDNKLKTVLDSYEWYFVPLLNPDGYEYSHTTDRLWKKNRRKEGVDLYKNFDAGFGLYGCVNDEKSDDFCGVSPFSEPETEALELFIRRNAQNMMFYYEINGYGQHIILPYHHKLEPTENHDTMILLAHKIASSIRTTYRTEYSAGTQHATFSYFTSGISASWVKETFRPRFSLTIMLRDQYNYGYALPRNQITPTCEEILHGLKEGMFRTLKNNFELKLQAADSDDAIIHSCSCYQIILVILLYFFIN